MSGLEYLASVVRRLSDAVEAIPSFRWATVTSKTPLRARFDGPSGEPEMQIAALFGEAAVGDRVLAIVASRRVYAFSSRSGAAESPFPPGFIQEYGGSDPPPGWLLCDGRQLRISDYPRLYAVIGRSFGGSGDYFALPNFRGRVSVGVDPLNAAFNQVGKVGGSANHTLSVEQMPRHRHEHEGYTVLWGSSGNVNINGAVAMSGASSGNRLFTFQGRDGWKNTHEVGGSQPFSLYQPYVSVNRIIKT